MNNFDSNLSQDNNPIFDIIQNLQSKLNSNESISQPEQVHNEPKQITNNGSSEFNLNNIMELLQNVGMNQNKTQSEVNENINSNPLSNLSNLNLDINTIMKFQRFFTSLNKSDPRKNLLTSLKPFMRETRQKNVDTYITLLGVISALDIFTNKGSE